MLRGLATSLIRRIKHDPTYEIAPELSPGDVFGVFRRRGASLILGQWTLRRVPGGRVRFAEPHARVRHRRHLTVGPGSVLEEYALLDCLSRDGFRIGARVTVGKYAIVEGTSVLWNTALGFSIGDNSSIGDYAFIGCAGGVTIGSRVLMGQRVSIHSENHNFRDRDRPIQEQGVVSKGVTIGDDCWLGAGVVILDGVTLGDGCVVAAGAVVTESFPPYSVVAGVPAKVVDQR